MSVENRDQPQPTDKPVESSFELRPTLRIHPFEVRERDFDCERLSADEPSRLLLERLTDTCGQVGFNPMEGDTDYELKGAFQQIDPGSRWKRYWSARLVGSYLSRWVNNGATRVRVTGAIYQKGKIIDSFEFTQEKHWDPNAGGDSAALIKRSIKDLAWSIAIDASRHVQGDASENADNAAAYLSMMWKACKISTVILSVISLVWALLQPLNHDRVHTYWGKLIWVGVVAVCIYAACLLVGVLVAPQRVLADRAFQQLRERSGVNTITAMRIILFFLLAGPLGMIYLLFTLFI